MDIQSAGDYTPCILASEGFENINIGALFDVQKLLGLDGGIVLDTRVIAHACPSAQLPPYQHEIFVIIGVNGTAITLADVATALRSIPSDAFQQNRSYYYEFIYMSPNRRFARIVWGS